MDHTPAAVRPAAVAAGLGGGPLVLALTASCPMATFPAGLPSRRGAACDVAAVVRAVEQPAAELPAPPAD